jgi:pimeloyl-ACP methyl ester carboxylesterase
MSTFFEPSISYWEGKGTQISNVGILKPSGAFNHTALTLFIHGYNNDQKAASSSYKLFLKLLNQSIQVSAKLVGVYWPGANWEGPLYYMQAIGQADKVALKLAKDLNDKAKALGTLRVDIVAHSLGCRLALATVKELSRILSAEGNSGLIIGKVVLMAGAVPVRYLEDNTKLKQSLAKVQGTLSLYSENDRVLHWAFPLGQTVVGGGFFPVALGRKKWINGDFVYPPVQQLRNVQADHSDYWGGSEGDGTTKLDVATTVANYLNLGPARPRELDSRLATFPRPLLKRVVENGRSVQKRVA